MCCLALAQAWQANGGQVTFALGTQAPLVEARLQNEGIEVAHLRSRPGSQQDATETLELARRAGAAWIVVDGYHFDAEYQRIIKGSEKSLLFIDDTGHADHYVADIVLNQNSYANAGLYPSKESYTKLLLGTAYALLRREFVDRLKFKRRTAEIASKILVTLGGADPNNVTLKLVKEIEDIKIKGLEIVVVVGSSNQHLATLQNAIAHSRHAIRLESNVSDMPRLMAWADVAISAGGSTCWELAFMGLPNFIFILADNQVQIAESLNVLGVALNLGWPDNLAEGKMAIKLGDFLANPKWREEMSGKGQELVDGLGTRRVLSHLNN